jgi:RNA polymerase sigma factor (TIGR02999 family)
MGDVSAGDITRWLAQIGGRDAAVNEALFEALYRELQRVARSHLRRETPGHTLSATGLVNEVYLRMAGQADARWKNRGHFLAVASQMMRRVLVNHALAKRAAKRDGERVNLTLGGLDELPGASDADVIRVHEALLAFETQDARAAKVVELRFFGGMEIDEIAEAMSLSPATVKRDWTFARSWLQRELAG